MLKRIYEYSTLEESLLSEAVRRSSQASEAAEKSSSYEYDALIGNLSYQGAPMCDGCFCADTCPDHPLLRRIVRWVKIIARSKHGMTVLFSVVPLVVGLLVGVYLGRKFEKSRPKSTEVLNSQTKQSFITAVAQKAAVWFCVLRMYVSEFLHFAVTAQWQTQEVGGNSNVQSTRSNDEKTASNSHVTGTSHAIPLEERSQHRQSGVDLALVPKHIAVIMDGNRRYGKSKYKSSSRGHVDGGYKLRDMVHWCLEECIQEMTVYAFSTENWNRSQTEIDALMDVFCRQCEELRKESVKLQIIVRVLSTQTDLIPDHVKEKLEQLKEDTRHCKGALILNVCLSYGSRGEITAACKSLAADCRDGKIAVDNITEKHVESRLLTRTSSSPDILLRTSGEVRLSNFLLWQCAYSEFFFLSKHWPELEKEDLLEVIRSFAHGRKRRFGT